MVAEKTKPVDRLSSNGNCLVAAPNGGVTPVAANRVQSPLSAGRGLPSP